jgi:tetratricopeptide (TPR) repeat protein
MIPSVTTSRYRLLILLLGSVAGVPAWAADSLLPYRDQIEQGYNARDPGAIEVVVTALKKAGGESDQEDLATYYAAFARLRQSAIPGTDKSRARDYLEECIDELEPLLKRRSDYAQARALYASCLGASSNYYVLRAATRGVAAGREMSAALKLAPDNPWVVFQAGVSDLLTPALFGGSATRALKELKRAEQLFVASRPAGSTAPLFGEAEAWLYIGRAYLAEGDKEKAREALATSLKLAPESADARDDLARL